MSQVGIASLALVSTGLEQETTEGTEMPSPGYRLRVWAGIPGPSPAQRGGLGCKERAGV